jgi:hypothetical protein
MKRERERERERERDKEIEREREREREERDKEIEGLSTLSPLYVISFSSQYNVSRHLLCWMTLAKAIARPARGKKQRVY